MAFVPLLLAACVTLQIGDDGLHSALVKPPGQPTTSQQTSPSAPPRSFPPASANVARELAARDRTGALLTTIFAGEAPGTYGARRLKLVDALVATPEAQREAAIAAYWNVSSAYAELLLIDRYRASLRQLQGTAMTEPERQLGEVAVREADAAEQVAAAKFQQAIQNLNELMGSTAADAFAPGSLPHAGGYDTRFDEIFAGKTSPGSLRLLNVRITAWREIVVTRADSVLATAEAHQAFLGVYGEGGARFADCLATARRVYEQEQAFCASVYQYNNDIASYALAVGGQQPPEVLAGMLIKENVPNLASSFDVAQRVIPASGTDGFRAAANPTNPPAGANSAPRTFHPPVDASPITPPARGNEAPTPTLPASSGSIGGSAQQGWEPVPGYKRAGDDSTSGAGTEPERTSANGKFRPLTDRYQSNYRGGTGTTTGQLPVQLAAWVAQRGTSGSANAAANSTRASLSLCECWERAADNQRARIAATYWQACRATAELNLEVELEESLRVRQELLLAGEDHPGRVAEMLLLRAARQDSVARQAEARQTQRSANFALAKVAAVENARLLESAVVLPDFGVTELETRLLLSDNSGDEGTEANRGAARWATFAAELQSREAAAVTATATCDALLNETTAGAMPAGDFLAAIAARRLAWRQGIERLVAYRSEVAAYVAANIPAAEQCQALVGVLPPDAE